MSRPVLCSAGQVCDTFGLRASSKSCPSGFYCLNGTKASSTSFFKNANSKYASKVWVTDNYTDVVYFNTSSLNYNFTIWPYPAYGKSRTIHPPIDSCDTYDCTPGDSSVIAEAPFPCPLGKDYAFNKEVLILTEALWQQGFIVGLELGLRYPFLKILVRRNAVSMDSFVQKDLSTLKEGQISSYCAIISLADVSTFILADLVPMATIVLTATIRSYVQLGKFGR